MKRLFVLYTLILFIISCDEKVREETTERFDNGNPKTIMKFKGEGSKEVMIEKITFSSKKDTLFVERPLEGFYYEKVREEIISRYSSGLKESVGYYIGEGDSEERIQLIEFYENGQKREEGKYRNKKQVGLYTEWYENGQKSNEGTYKSGKREGLWTSWYENGQKNNQGSFKNDKSEGLWNFWYEDGQKWLEQIYEEGRLISEKTLNKDGSVKEYIKW